MDKLLTAKQVSYRLGVCYNTVLKYFRTGEIIAFKLGGNGSSNHQWRVKESELNAYIEGK